MRLFKYLGPDRTDVISNLKIRFTPPIIFNDPFELRPWITDGIPKKNGITSAERLYKQGEITSSQRDFLVSSYERKYDKRIWPHVWEMMSDLIASTSLCLSLTEIPDSLLMWAHYAKNHEGFLLGFDAYHSYFQEKKEGIYCLSKVIYSNDRPNIKFHEITLENHFFTKGNEWSYEKEWRLFEKDENAAVTIKNGKIPIHLFEIPASALVEIRLGCKMSNELKREIVNNVKSNASLAHIEIKQASIHQSRYAINFKTI